jgi:hypothetical protein
MRSYTAVIERCADTGLFVGYVPGFRGRIRRGRPSMNCLRICAKRSRCCWRMGSRRWRLSSSARSRYKFLRRYRRCFFVGQAPPSKRATM